MFRDVSRYSARNMSLRSRVFLVGIGMLAIATILWSIRGAFRDAWTSSQQPSLPVAQSFHAPVPVIGVASSSPVQVTSSRQGAATSTKVTPPRVTTVTSTRVVSSTVSADLPETVNLAVPFLSQAPKQNWDMPYQEACEEASVIMVDAYLRGRTKAYVPEEGDGALLQMIAYEESLGKKPDLAADDLQEVVTGYFGNRMLEIVRNPTIRLIKERLAAGYPVIVPASGKMLGNPNFHNGGPVYHMLVIKGYLKDGRWITNDPGTRRGANYLYDQDVLMNALHDWNGGDVPHGTPTMIVLLPD